MRPYWKGYLKLALVSCPTALHAACSTSFDGLLVRKILARLTPQRRPRIRP
jgi:non-homologous end joining protein Ku